jgi:bifunctional DNA-binding transcriptional regulator/antitoxin component of YhaV-PrlF toxin-antitoxin module
MKTHRITSAGQLSIPAAVRRRWKTNRVAVEDLGDRLIVRPVPEDPVAAARGSFRGRIGTTSELRAAARSEDTASTRRR